MIQITDKLFDLEVPSDAHSFRIDKSGKINRLLCLTTKDEYEYFIDYLPNDAFKIVGTCDKNTIDFDCEPYLKITTENAQGDDYGDKCYWNYKEECYGFYEHKQSFRSLLASKGLNPNAKHLIIEKI